jgi:AraC-like DNA-binding protein
MTEKVPKITAAHLGPALHTLGQLGEDPLQLLANHDLSPKVLENPDHQVPIKTVSELWARAAEASGDPAYGLHMAEKRPKGEFGLVEYILLASSTLGESWERTSSATSIVSNDIDVHLERQGDRAMLVHDFPGVCPAIHDLTVASFHMMACEMTGLDTVADEIWIARPQPESLDEHQRVLGNMPLFFEQDVDALVVSAEKLDLPVKSADPGLVRLLDRQLGLDSSETPIADPLRDVKRAISAELVSGDPTASRIAKRLSMSERSLHRRLSAEDTRFGTVLDEVRKRLACEQLKSPHQSIAEVSWHLGFSEPSAFHRAFKRWTGETPGTWRQKHSQR